MRYLLLFTILLIVCRNTFGYAPDSIGVKTVAGKQFIIHKINAHEGWYGIARRYNVNVKTLREANPNTGEKLRINDTILVPRSAAKVAETPIREIKKPDTSLEVKPKSTSDSGKSTPEKSATPDKSQTHAGMKEVSESGIATWIIDDDINPNKYFALHRTAPIGTIIKVTNRMNNKYIFVKVVGVLPDTGDNTSTIIKISKASAEKLDVRDPKFQCTLSFMAAVAKSN